VGQIVKTRRSGRKHGILPEAFYRDPARCIPVSAIIFGFVTPPFLVGVERFKPEDANRVVAIAGADRLVQWRYSGQPSPLLG
jgi:hypothetical protein